MSEEIAFKKTDWIGQGKSMATAPPIIHRMAKDEFSLPQYIEFDLIPSPFISIREMLKFSVPLLSVPNSGPQPAPYFSKDAPDPVDKNTIQRLHNLPIPDEKVVRNLVHASRQAWLDGYKSIMYNNLSGSVVTRFPLWVLTYWNDILDFKRDVRGPWIKSSDWLAQQKKQCKRNPMRAALLEETTQILSMMPWGWAKPHGLSDSEPLYSLYRFLGTQWLAGSQMNDMLELLRHKIDGDLALPQKFRVQGTAFVPKILEAYTAGAEAYKENREFRWLRNVGESLAQNNAVLITAGHLGKITSEPHWIGLIFDLSDSTSKILYGDSFDGHVPEVLLVAARWWMDQHTEAHLQLEKLPIGVQKDSYSCGMFVNNGLEHFIDSEIPLSEPGGNFVDARLKTFNAIGKWALERVGVSM